MKINFYNTRAVKRAQADAERPEGNFRLFFWVFRHHFWDLCKLNFFVLLHSLGIVTAFPAFAAMNRVIFNMIDGKPQLLWEEYRSVFRRELKPAALFGIPVLMAGAVLFYLTGISRQTVVKDWVSVLAFAGLVLLFLFTMYVLNMLPYVEISFRQCLKNSALMLILCIGTNFVTFLALIALLAVFALLMPLSVPFAVFLLIPLAGYLTSFAAYTGIKKYTVVAGEEKEN